MGIKILNDKICSADGLVSESLTKKDGAPQGVSTNKTSEHVKGKLCF